MSVKKKRRFAKCNHCGRVFASSQKTKNIRCACRKYASEITEDEYNLLTGKDKTDELKINQKKTDLEHSDIEIELPDESEIEELEIDEIPAIIDPFEVKKDESENQLTSSSSALGSMVVVFYNIALKFKGYRPLDEQEREELKIRADAVAIKHPEWFSNFDYGEEVELVESVSSIWLKRTREVKKDESKNQDNTSIRDSRKNRQREIIFG